MSGSDRLFPGGVPENSTDVKGSGLLSKVQIAYARVSSAQRVAGDPNNFSVFLTPQVTRCVGFYVSSVDMFNDWYTIDSDHVRSYWEYNGGGVTAVDITPGYYDTQVSFCAELQRALRAAFATSTITVVYDGIENKVQYTAAATATADTLTFNQGLGGVEGTLNVISGLDMPQAIYTSTGNVAQPPLGSSAVGWNQLRLNTFDPPFIDLVSPQLRQPISIDTLSQGGNNTFFHLLVNVFKLFAVTFQAVSPTEFNVIKYPSPQEFQYLQVSVRDPNTGKLMQVLQDWEMVLCFLVVV